MSGGPLKAPDWTHWSEIGATELWKAVALSFDVDPDDLTIPDGRIDRISFSSIADPDLTRFQKRLRVAESQLGQELKAVSVVEKDGRRFDSLVRLADFGRWAMSKKWLGSEFPKAKVERRKPTAKKERVTPPRTETLSILFLDLAGWSRLSTPQIVAYLEKALPKLADKIGGFNSTHLNTWGDAVVATFSSSTEAANCALDIRDFFRRAAESEGVPPGLTPRISLHVGDAIIAHNPILGREDIFGEAVHLAARLEPVTPRGHVFCTEQFANALRGLKGVAPVAHDLGELDLPKRFGSIRVFAVTGPNEDAPARPPAPAPAPPTAVLPPPPSLEEKPLSDAEISAMFRVMVSGLAKPGTTLSHEDIIKRCHPRINRDAIARLLPAAVQGTNWQVTVGEATASFEYRPPVGIRVSSRPPRGY